MSIFLFTISITLSAFLLFWLQPLTAKFFLPILGGTPSVWQTCMVFFQGLLLLGYTYTHVLCNTLRFPKQLLVHTTIVISAVVFLPIMSQPLPPMTAEQSPLSWLLWNLFRYVAIPFFVISTSAPLLQRWYSYDQRRSARDPYTLYAASNVGSLLALLSFPFVLEPLLGNTQQASVWTFVYLLYSVMLIASGISLLRQPIQDAAVPYTTRHIRHAQRWHWVILAFLPSSLLLGVTTTITTDIASTPLFWVIPLAIYLTTFIICFNPTSAAWYRHFNQLQPVLLLILAFLLILARRGQYHSSAMITVQLLVFASTTFILHGQLYHARPDKRGLTEFYLLIAFGGFLGGIFNSVLAPMIFNGPWEYPLMLCIACYFRLAPSQLSYLKGHALWVPALSVTTILLFYGLHHFLHFDYTTYAQIYTFLYVLTAATLLLLQTKRRAFCGQLALVLIVLPFIHKPNFTTVYQQRNFFGLLRILDFPTMGLRTLKHGTTMHGAERLPPHDKSLHFSYYYPITDIARSLHPQHQSAHIAIAGLGAGTLACILGGNQRDIHFYEIDPDVVKIAKNPHFFHYLSDCPPSGGILLGDARISLRRAQAHYYDLIVLDAFSSDAVPTHLINLEAVQLYLAKLRPYGILAFNISNRHLNLIPVLGAICNKQHLSCYSKTYLSRDLNVAFHSKWVMITRPNANIADTLAVGNWHSIPKTITTPLWTDNFSNIVSVLE